QIEPAEILRVAYVLQIVKDRDVRTGRYQRAGEAGVEKHVAAGTRGGPRQAELLEQDSRRPIHRPNVLRLRMEVPRRRREAGGLAVGEDEILVLGIDARQRR